MQSKQSKRMFSTVVCKDYVKSMFYRVNHSGNNHMDEVRFLKWISTFLFHEDELYKFVHMFRLHFLLNLILIWYPIRCRGHNLVTKDYSETLTAGYVEGEGSFPVPPFKIPSFMFVLCVITAKCVMLRCKVWKRNLVTVVDLFTTPNFIRLWQR